MENIEDKGLIGKRTFSIDKDIYIIVPPNAEIIRGADWNYSKVYTKSLVEGITTAAEMQDLLTKRGIIGEEFRKRAEELGMLLQSAIVELQEATNDDEKRDLAFKVASAREEAFQWNQRLNSPMSNTCEQMADDARLEYITALTVKRVNGSAVWDSYDAYLKEKNQNLSLRARFEVMLYLQGMDSDFLEQTPEATAIREIEESLTLKAQEALLRLQEVKESSDKIEKVEESEASKEVSEEIKTSANKKSVKKKISEERKDEKE